MIVQFCKMYLDGNPQLLDIPTSTGDFFEHSNNADIEKSLCYKLEDIFFVTICRPFEQ